jgi:ACS family pantothenate transporter-like MFS transporter
MVIVATGPSYGATFFGYLINAASWGFWPVLYVSLRSYLHESPLKLTMNPGMGY